MTSLLVARSSACGDTLGRGMVYWWTGQAGEDVFMEITDRELPAEDLLAPLAARGGALTASYKLVPAVEPDDVVLHYDTNIKAIMGVSRATGGPEPAALWWVAHGTNAIKAGAEEAWLPGVRVPLDDFTPIDPPVTLAEIRAVEGEILDIRGDLLAAHGDGTPLYFPWVEYSGQPLRTFQTYLAKFPSAVVALFPRVEAAVAAVRGAGDGVMHPVSEVVQAEDAVESAAGTGRSPRGQGYLVDQAVKVALEVYGMNQAIEYYAERGWDVEDVHGDESFDLTCTKGQKVKHVEVKATTTDGIEVLLTPNEVKHARRWEDVALFIVRKVRVVRHEAGAIEATGGELVVLDPWAIGDGELKPVGYRHLVPSGGRVFPPQEV